MTVVESRCRSGFHTQGQEYIIDENRTICPPVCMELWHHAYPYVWALLNGAKLDNGPDKGTSCDICCPDGCRVKLHIETVE